jgi:hypothetical protein
MPKKRSSSGTPGKTTTRTIARGPNKGDKVTFKFGPSGKPYPTRVVRDVGRNSTLRDNPGVKFGKKKK